jgi:uncharacterized BrkB/YihY/UPF0761 family membrane protein
MENRKVLKAISYLAIILLAVVARLVPHPANFAPIGGLALFSGTNFKNKFSFLIPMLAMLISDIFLGFHATMPFIYLSFFIIYFIGRNTKINKWQNLLLVSLISSILFFIITNFGVWLYFNTYPKTIEGLIQCYMMGIPFFRNTLLSDLLYSFSFFYGYRFLSNFLLAF